MVKFVSPSVADEYEVAEAEATIAMFCVEAAEDVSIIQPSIVTLSVPFKRTAKPPVARMYRSSTE